MVLVSPGKFVAFGECLVFRGLSHREVKLNELVLMNSGDIKFVTSTNKSE